MGVVGAGLLLVASALFLLRRSLRQGRPLAAWGWGWGWGAKRAAAGMPGFSAQTTLVVTVRGAGRVAGAGNGHGKACAGWPPLRRLLYGLRDVQGGFQEAASLSVCTRWRALTP